MTRPVKIRSSCGCGRGVASWHVLVGMRARDKPIFFFQCTEKATPKCVSMYLISTKITYSNGKANTGCGEKLEVPVDQTVTRIH